jgi:CBS domain-containing protein
MSPQQIANTVRREIPPLRDDERVRDAVAAMIKADVAELPVVDADGVLQGTFGEREFIAALFPGYLRQIGHAGFVPRSLDEALDKRAICADEPVRKYMNLEAAEVGEDFSDTQLAEIFLHHGVLTIPIVDGGRVSGIVTREDFVRVLGERWLAVS